MKKTNTTRALVKNNAIHKKSDFFKVLKKIVVIKFYTQQKKIKNSHFQINKSWKIVLPANRHYKKL